MHFGISPTAAIAGAGAEGEGGGEGGGGVGDKSEGRRKGLLGAVVGRTDGRTRTD